MKSAAVFFIYASVNDARWIVQSNTTQSVAKNEHQEPYTLLHSMTAMTFANLDRFSCPKREKNLLIERPKSTSTEVTLACLGELHWFA